MRVLVTGGAGYIGSVIIEELARAGHTPVVYDSFVKGHPHALDGSIAVVQGDIGATEKLREALQDHAIDAVIHMAALIEAGLSVSQPERFFATNVAGTVSVLRAMADAGVKKLVFSSTGSLYGETDRLPIPEEEPTRPTNPYAESKLIAERMIGWAAPAHNMVCTALRYFNAAGATERNGEDHAPETHLIPLVLRAASEGRSISVFGTDYATPDGTAVRDYVHVADLAQAHLLALGRTEVGLRVYNVGNGNGYSVRQVIETARAVTGAPLPVEEHPRRPGDWASSVASSQRIRQELGWKPAYADLHTIIESAWKWRQSHPHGYGAA